MVLLSKSNVSQRCAIARRLLTPSSAAGAWRGTKKASVGREGREGGGCGCHEIYWHLDAICCAVSQVLHSNVLMLPTAGVGCCVISQVVLA